MNKGFHLYLTWSDQASVIVNGFLKDEILKTSSEQIITRKVPVDYKCSVCIHCHIKSDGLSTLKLKMKEHNDAIANWIDICKVYTIIYVLD